MASLNSITRLPGTIVHHCIQYLSKRNFSNNYARICTTNRPLYKRMYPTLFLCPDGSSFTSRFYEPRQVIKFPMDISLMTEEDRIKWLAKRKPIKKVIYENDVKSSFKSKQYIDLIKKKKK